MRMPCRARTAVLLALPVAALVLAAGGAAAAPGAPSSSARGGVAQVRPAQCTPQDLSGCNGTDAPEDPSLLRYCGPDGTCAPVAHRGTPRHTELMTVD